MMAALWEPAWEPQVDRCVAQRRRAKKLGYKDVVGGMATDFRPLPP